MSRQRLTYLRISVLVQIYHTGDETCLSNKDSQCPLMLSVHHSEEEFEENHMEVIMLAALECKFCVRTKKHEIQNYIHELQKERTRSFQNAGVKPSSAPISGSLLAITS